MRGRPAQLVRWRKGAVSTTDDHAQAPGAGLHGRQAGRDLQPRAAALAALPGEAGRVPATLRVAVMTGWAPA